MITLRFMGPLMRPDPDAVAQVLRTSATVSELLGGLGYAADHQRFLQVSAQGRRLSLDDPLPADGEIVIALPMGGG